VGAALARRPNIVLQRGSPVFYVSYALSELRRRKGRTILTALGLAVGVALVVVVNALSTGLKDAQANVLKPLTGVGTDMTVTRPLVLSTRGSNPFANLTPAQRSQLRKEAGGQRVGFRNIAKPGKKFSVDRFGFSGQLTFPQSTVAKIKGLKDVAAASGSLSLNDTHISGTMPKQSATTSPSTGGTGNGGGFGGGGFGGNGTGGARTPGGGFFGGPNGINFTSMSVNGIDTTTPSLAPVTPSQITTGRYFKSSGDAYAAVLSTSYADTNNLKVGKTITLDGKKFTIIGLATAPLGGSASDVYVELPTLQKLAGDKGVVNTMAVEATTGSAVTTVQNEVKKTLSGAQVTTAAALASRIGGSLKDAKNLSTTLGVALEIVGLLAAVLIALLLTLSSVAKRTREIGTLKAIGWSQALVVRQISFEALVQGLLGGIAGAILGFIAAAVVTAMRIPLQATIAPAESSIPFGFGRFGGGGPFGQAGQAASAASTTVHINAPVDTALILIAVALAALAGLIAGAIGGMRAGALRPASALRTVE
jgi:ABC-type antimicrobial peptide transport system permease subunit